MSPVLILDGGGIAVSQEALDPIIPLQFAQHLVQGSFLETLIVDGVGGPADGGE